MTAVRMARYPHVIRSGSAGGSVFRVAAGIEKSVEEKVHEAFDALFATTRHRAAVLSIDEARGMVHYVLDNELSSRRCAFGS
jgi:hypothetical protein